MSLKTRSLIIIIAAVALIIAAVAAWPLIFSAGIPEPPPEAFERRIWAPEAYALALEVFSHSGESYFEYYGERYETWSRVVKDAPVYEFVWIYRDSNNENKRVECLVDSYSSMVLLKTSRSGYPIPLDAEPFGAERLPYKSLGVYDAIEDACAQLGGDADSLIFSQTDKPLVICGVNRETANCDIGVYDASARPGSENNTLLDIHVNGQNGLTTPRYRRAIFPRKRRGLDTRQPSNYNKHAFKGSAIPYRIAAS